MHQVIREAKAFVMHGENVKEVTEVNNVINPFANLVSRSLDKQVEGTNCYGD